MNSELGNFLEIVRLRAEVMRQKARLDRVYARPLYVFLRAQLLPLVAWRTKRRLVGRTVAQKPVDMMRDLGDLQCRRLSTDLPLYTITLHEKNQALDPSVVPQGQWVGRHPHVLVIHAYYEEEAAKIFALAQQLQGIDIVLTTCKESIAQEFFRAIPHAHACFLIPNTGRDILPFLLAVHVLGGSSYRSFIKLHTKRSLHACDGGAWFYESVESLIGSPRMMHDLLARIDPSRSDLYGVETLSILDHYENNKPWLCHLVGEDCQEVPARFVPGSMFMGSGAWLQALGAQALWLHRFEDERGQLDGTLAHALERYFGVIALQSGGVCDTLSVLAQKEMLP